MALANGRISTASLTAIPARFYSHGDGAFLRADAAASFLRLAAAFEARFGKPLVCISFYRTYDRQVEIFRERYTPRPASVTRKVVSSDRVWQGRVWRLAPGRAPSATPGYSNHGLGQAADFHSGVQTAGTAEHKWFQANAPAYGWDFAEGRRNGEPWHWVYNATLDRHKHDKALAAGTVTAASAATSTRVAATRDVQAALVDLGYDPGPVDGQDGTKTRAAVRAYQADAGIPVDGIAGTTTRSHMEADMAKIDDLTKAVAALAQSQARQSQILEALDVHIGNRERGRVAQAAEVILGRHSQILEAVDVRTGNSTSGRLAQAADRILGVLPGQRTLLVAEVAQVTAQAVVQAIQSGKTR